MNFSWLSLPLIVNLIGPAKTKQFVIMNRNEPAKTLYDWGRLIEANTMIVLSPIDNIVGMKDACGDLTITMEILRATRDNPQRFWVLCGGDALTFPMLSL